jgi:hypothetical protein
MGHERKSSGKPIVVIENIHNGGRLPSHFLIRCHLGQWIYSFTFFNYLSSYKKRNDRKRKRGEKGKGTEESKRREDIQQGNTVNSHYLACLACIFPSVLKMLLRWAET